MDVSGMTDMNGNFEGGSPPPSPLQRSSPRRKSFAQIDQDLDNPESQGAGESEPPPSESPPGADKGKRKALLEDIQEEDEERGEDEEEEDEIAHGLDDIDGEPEFNSSLPSKKRVRVEEPAQKPRARRSKKENRSESCPLKCSCTSSASSQYTEKG
jgi:centromere protein C